jgi:putative glutamine amidotransferase
MTQKRPLIGITTDTVDDKAAYHLYFEYATAIEKAGGLPIAIPYRTDLSLIPQYVDRLDGILFTGGNDLDPNLYGQQWHPKAVRIDPARQTFELALMAEVEKRRLPALCICLGCQLLNVYRGGTLHQFIPDLPDKQEHRKLGETPPRHSIRIEPGSQLGAAIGKTEVFANSYHKQAVKEPGRGLRVVATSPDGIIEGLEDPSFPLLAAVQWHPERLADEAEHLAPFKLLVQKATK